MVPWNPARTKVSTLQAYPDDHTNMHFNKSSADTPGPDQVIDPTTPDSTREAIGFGKEVETRDCRSTSEGKA